MPTSTRLLAALILIALLAACSERETSIFTDTVDDSTASDSTEPEDTSEPEDTAPPEDTSPPQDTAIQDIDEGPKEFTNGATVRFGHIVDGDTVDVLVGNIFPARYSVRMLGLAAPECYKERVSGRFQCVSDDEFHGLAAREALVALLEGKTGTVTCDDVALGEWCPKDNFDRYLAYFEVDGVDIATEMARLGHGFSYTSFNASKRAQICAAEYEAQDAGRGMWAAGSVNTVINMMSTQTQNWYFSHHDERCDAALGR